MTGRIVECPIDEMNKPRGRKQAALRIPPTDAEITALFTGWRQELVSCRKFAPTARNYLAAKLMSQVGLRVIELSFDRCGVGATKPAHDDVRMSREVVEECAGVRSQNLDFGDGQRWQIIGQAVDTGGAQPGAERDAAAGPRGDGTRIEDFACDRVTGGQVAGIQGAPSAAWMRTSSMFWPCRTAVAV